METKEEMLARLHKIVADETVDFEKRWRASFCYAVLVFGKEVTDD